jgi:hypothetical protein
MGERRSPFKSFPRIMTRMGFGYSTQSWVSNGWRRLIEAFQIFCEFISGIGKIIAQKYQEENFKKNFSV